jgi:tetrapyrrole methylase family protein / MazG family protein
MTEKFEEFVNIVKRLRKDCPWDRVQTFDSLKASTLEEAFEAVESIDIKDYNELKYELGDLLLHVVLYSIIAEEQNLFTLKNVLESSMEKLIRRHPHVFSDLNLTDAEAVKTNWERIKMTEGRQSALDGVPVNLPALSKAYRLQEKASKVGFDWEKPEDVWKKVEEEMQEFKETLNGTDIHRTEEELGDFLFALVNYARFFKINPENALRKTSQKFIRRFQYIEQKFKENGKDIYKSTLGEMDEYWNEIKAKEKQ